MRRNIWGLSNVSPICHHLPDIYSRKYMTLNLTFKMSKCQIWHLANRKDRCDILCVCICNACSNCYRLQSTRAWPWPLQWIKVKRNSQSEADMGLVFFTLSVICVPLATVYEIVALEICIILILTFKIGQGQM